MSFKKILLPKKENYLFKTIKTKQKIKATFKLV